MKTHTIDNETYAIFDPSEKGGLWMMHFIWGKKDFRIFLERHAAGSEAPARGPVLHSETAGDAHVERLQNLNGFEWYDFDKVGGHGLAHDHVRWKRGHETRYVELTKDFFGTAVRLTCLEFGLEPREPASMAR